MTPRHFRRSREELGRQAGCQVLPAHNTHDRPSLAASTSQSISRTPRIAPTLTVAEVIRVSSVLAEVAHRVVRCDVLRVLLDKLLHRGPQRRDRLLELEQCDRKPYDVPHSGGRRTVEEGVRRTVNLVMVFHVQERIFIDHAVEVNVGLDAPIVLVLLQERMTEEEPGVETTHVAIRYTPCISSFLDISKNISWHAPPYIIFCSTRSSLLRLALSSSIQSG